MSRRLREVAIALLWIVGGVFLWRVLVPDLPWDDFSLTRDGVTAEGVLTDVWEERDSGERGQDVETYGYSYRFTTAAGQVVAGEAKGNGRLRPGAVVGASTPVEYLPNRPEVNRATDGVPDSEWQVALRLILAFALLAAAVGPGGFLLFRAFYPAAASKGSPYDHI